MSNASRVPLHTVDIVHRWLEPLALVLLLALGLLVALYAVRVLVRAREFRKLGPKQRLPAPARMVGAFGIAFVAVLAFVRIAREMVEGDTQKMDSAIELAVHRMDTPALDVVMRGFTFLGSAFAVLPFSLAVVGWSLRRKDMRAAFTLLIVIVMTEALNEMLKRTFERPRPTLFQEIETLHSYSFPSGHAMAAVAIYGMLGVVLRRRLPASRRLVGVLMLTLILMICISRIYLGVHWPSDVLAGAAAGAFVLLAGAITLFDPSQMRDSERPK